jgi:hypothetical protein
VFALVFWHAEASILHAQRSKDAALQEDVKTFARDPPDDSALDLLLQSVAAEGSGLRFQGQLH